MLRRDLKLFLLLEFLAIFWAGAVFKIFSDRWWAGIFAGIYFVGSAGWMFWRAVHGKRRWRSFCVYPLIVHLFGISIPLMVERIIYSHVEFNDAKIWGIPGPVFHQISTTLFSILIMGTLIDLYRTRAGSFATPRRAKTNLS